MNPQPSESWDVLVIGSGAGGMTAATALARAGQRVLVLEQHYLPGGWCHSFSLEGHQFSPGVHYIGGLGADGPMRRIWEGLGLGHDLAFARLQPDGFDHVVVGTERFDIPAGRERFMQRLIQRFPDEAPGIRTFFHRLALLGRALEHYGEAPDWPARIRALPRIWPIVRWGLQPWSRFVGSLLRDPLLRTLVSIQAGDHGVAPSRVLTALHAAIVWHYIDGGWYPVGGARAIPRALLRRLRAAGGQIRVRTPVAAIELDQDSPAGRVTGVRLADGTRLKAPHVISNADPEVTWRQLLPATAMPAAIRRRLEATRWSASCISLFLAVEADPARWGLDSGNLWYVRQPDLEASYANTLDPHPDAWDRLDSFFLTCTSLKDPAHRARDGVHTMEAFVLVHPGPFERWQQSDPEDRPADYLACRDTLMERMLALIDEALPGLRDHIVFQELGTPVTNRFYTAGTRGHIYGTEKTADQMLKHAWPHQTPLQGLWMCGASTSGHGVAGATMSGLACAAELLGVPRDSLLRPGEPSIRTVDAET